MSKFISVFNSGGAPFAGPLNENLLNVEEIISVVPQSGANTVQVHMNIGFDLIAQKPNFYQFTVSPPTAADKVNVATSITEAIDIALEANGPCVIPVSLPAGVTVTGAGFAN